MSAWPGEKFVILVARQRSGTTVLRRFLDSDPNIRELGERLSGRNPHGLHVAIAKGAQRPNFAFSRADINGALEEAFSGYAQQYPERSLIIDAKYNSMGPFNGYGWGVNDDPQFITYCRGRGMRFIHLIRRDVLASVASEMLATRTGIWHSKDIKGESEKREPIKINPDGVVRACLRAIQEIIRFKRIIKDGDQSCTLYYEDMIVNDALTAPALATLGQLFGRPLQLRDEAPLRKVSPPVADYISNYDEVLKALHNSKGYARLLAKV